MGLLDIIQGMKNGPRGQRQPSRSGSGGWTSRIMMALLGLLAYKAFKGGAIRNRLGHPPTPTRRGAAGCRDRSRTVVGGPSPKSACEPDAGRRHDAPRWRFVKASIS